jgi:ABC-2 type transport system permease protein
MGRELRQAFRRRTFWVTVAIAFVASTAAGIQPAVLGGGRDAYEIGVVGGDDALADALHATGRVLDADITLRPLASTAAAEDAVDEGAVTIAVVAGDTPSVVVRSGQHAELAAFARQVLAQRQLAGDLAQAGLSPTQVEDAIGQPAVPIDQRRADDESRRGAAAIIAVGLYIILLMLTIQVSGGVAIEKANRISEVLLAVVRPAPLLFGKVIAVGLIGVLTLLAGVVPVVVKLVLGGDLPAGLVSGLVAGGAWFLLGAALYLTIAGALGALVERQEEAGSAVAPLSIILIGSYIVGQSASDSPLGAVLSVLPLSSAMVMPSRIAVGDASATAIAASLVLAAGSVVVAVRIGAGVYRRAIVRTGRRLKLGEVLRAP